MHIPMEVARRFVLGKSGLWPGRRWRGLEGAEQAMRAVEHLQLDPLVVVARAHDLMLASRVIDYSPDDWSILTYEQRRFFEWGGWLAVRAMDELPHWRVLMRRERDNPRMRAILQDHGPAIDEMRAVLRERAEVSNRDFAMGSRTRVDSYRGRKDSALALHYLWRVGEAMVTRRERFERVYALPEAVAPAKLLEESDETTADDFLRLKAVAADGLARATTIGNKAWRDRKLSDGELIEIGVDGWRAPHVALASDSRLLETLAAGCVPQAWAPLETTTTDEATFLAPLDPVSARGRAKLLFDFDYVWEVYVPAGKRRWGYYTLPVLWGDRLVARFDSKLDRPTSTLVINGLWLENEALATDDGFADALARGMDRFITFLGAAKLDAKAVAQPRLRRRLSARPRPRTR